MRFLSYLKELFSEPEPMKLADVRLCYASNGPWYAGDFPVPVEFVGRIELPMDTVVMDNPRFGSLHNAKGQRGVVYLLGGYKEIYYK